MDLADPDRAMIQLNDSQEYTGQAIKPEVTILYQGKVIPTADYTVQYRNNKNVGTAEVTVKGKKNCGQSITRQFQIVPRTITARSVTVSVKDGAYTGKTVMPKVTVKDGKVNLKVNKDYILAYEDNTDASTAARVTVTGSGNYTDERRQNFTIKQMTVPIKKITAVLNVSYGNQSA